MTFTSKQAMVPRPDFNTYAMNLAIVASTRATCIRRSVGAVLVDFNNHILAIAYNGVPRGQPHCSEGFLCTGAGMPSGTGLDACNSIHAEQNALLICSDPFKIRAVYCTTKPCLACTKLLLNTSCESIYFKDDYSHDISKLWTRNIKQL